MVETIKISYRDGAYRVSKPNWDGGEVVMASDYAALEAQLAERVKVKALNWGEYKALGNSIKTLAFDCFGREFKRFDMRLSQIPQAEIDATQADYERRILSALSP